MYENHEGKTTGNEQQLRRVRPRRRQSTTYSSSRSSNLRCRRLLTAEQSRRTDRQAVQAPPQRDTSQNPLSLKFAQGIVPTNPSAPPPPPPTPSTTYTKRAVSSATGTQRVPPDRTRRRRDCSLPTREPRRAADNKEGHGQDNSSAVNSSSVSKQRAKTS